MSQSKKFMRRLGLDVKEVFNQKETGNKIRFGSGSRRDLLRIERKLRRQKGKEDKNSSEDEEMDPAVEFEEYVQAKKEKEKKVKSPIDELAPLGYKEKKPQKENQDNSKNGNEKSRVEKAVKKEKAPAKGNESSPIQDSKKESGQKLIPEDPREFLETFAKVGMTEDFKRVFEDEERNFDEQWRRQVEKEIASLQSLFNRF